MGKGVEVYLRPLGDGAILNIYVPADLAAEFVRSLQAGTFSNSVAPIAFEMSVQPHWYSGDDDQHVRVPVSAINLSADE